MTYCKQCLAKKQKINEFEEEISSLKNKLRYQERTAQEDFFGSSTPSWKGWFAQLQSLYTPSPEKCVKPTAEK